MIRYPTRLLCLLAALLPACGGDTHRPSHEIRGSSMGTSFNIVIVDPAPDLSLDELTSQIRERLEHIENVASTYRDSSDLGKFNLDPSTDWIIVSDELCRMVFQAAAIGRETGGAFDITIGPLVDLWGFGPDDRSATPPSDSEIEILRDAVGLEKLDIDCDQSRLRKSVASTEIDLSGWAKGYAVDQLAELLDAAAQDDYLIEVGGELRLKGRNADDLPFAIAIENPATAVLDGLTIIRLSNTGIATSGDYRNFFEYQGARYSHTLDPATGRPVTHRLSAVTVIHPSTAYADAMATALLVLGPGDGLEFANSHDLAALFAVSTPAGLEYRSSAAFDAGHFVSP